ncbi:MAG: hypothetical protein RBT15_03490 [Gudongella sp.]|jgi:hypothetical protein|nr:hypothetical protein [Gudongella sp.]
MENLTLMQIIPATRQLEVMFYQDVNKKYRKFYPIVGFGLYSDKNNQEAEHSIILPLILTDEGTAIPLDVQANLYAGIRVKNPDNSWQLLERSEGEE